MAYIAARKTGATQALPVKTVTRITAFAKYIRRTTAKRMGL